MKKKILLTTLASLCLTAQAQKTSCASFMRTTPQADVVIPYKYDAPGIKTPLEWGLDLAWLDDANVRTGIFYAGRELIDIIRLSFQPTHSVENGTFHSEQTKDLNRRIDIVKKWCKEGVGYNINCDHKSMDKWYDSGTYSTPERAKRWAKLIDMTADYYKAHGLTHLVSLSPLNEPDYDYHELPNPLHRKADFREICRLLKEDEAYKEKYKDVRICGGNTLNDDKAYEWWNYLKDYLDEGNTHQLAGSFDNYASFYETILANGMHATNDELHNVMEAMVGAEYGLQTGIWWGTCEKTRSDFMKATWQGNPGERLGYGEHRNNWTAASVYRHADGRVQAFGGTSERQAVSTSYNFVATDRPVWYNGQRGCEYHMDIQGGTGYQQGQTNYENVIDIQAGDDVMPLLTEGTYKIVNAKTGKVLGFTSNPGTGWAALKQQSNALANPGWQQWQLRHVESGDRAYWILQLNTSGTPLYIDILNWSLEDGAEVGTYPGGLGTNEQWYLEYAGQNAFYIRSRYNTKCLEVPKGSSSIGTAVKMATVSGEEYQKWKFLPVNAKPDTRKPGAPAALKATAHNASVELTWTAPTDRDVRSYTVLRSKDGETFATLANGIATTQFTDNEAQDGITYYYKVYTEDLSLNRSDMSETVSAASTMDKGELLRLSLQDQTLADLTENANHAALCGDTLFSTYKEEACLTLDGSTHYLQLPYSIANHEALSISMWVHYGGGNNWARLFDFGNGTDQYMFLTANSGSGLQFAIKNGGEEQLVKPATPHRLPTTQWSHVVFTLDNGTGILYLNGEEIARNEHLTIKPTDFNPVLNYIGRSQYPADPLFKGHLRQVVISNYALTPEEVKNEATAIKDIRCEDAADRDNAHNAYLLNGVRATDKSRGIVIQGGRKMKISR